MNGFLTDDTKAIILLCGVFGKDRSAKPLTQVEYTSLVHWLMSVEMRPCDLLKNTNIADAAIGASLEKQRLKSLLGRGVQLGFTVEEWQRNGIWIISRSDLDYPARYKKHLIDKAPPLLFGVGERALLAGGGLGIVGSRNIDKEGESFTRHVAEQCALNAMPVVSGGARGVDQTAMNANLDAGGIAIGIVAENLLKKSLDRSARHAISDGRLLLISPYHPTGRFTVGTAMARNKLIYAMAEYGLIVSAEYKKGGTWAGATEELRRENPRPIFVRFGSNVPHGNGKLLELGAIEWPESIEKNNFKEQLAKIITNNQPPKKVKQPTLFGVSKSKGGHLAEINQNIHVEVENLEIANEVSDDPSSIYEAVLSVILKKLEKATNSDDLAERLDVNKTQLKVWLKKAVEDGFVRKYSRPVRYEALKTRKTQQGAAPDGNSAALYYRR